MEASFYPGSRRVDETIRMAVASQLESTLNEEGRHAQKIALDEMVKNVLYRPSYTGVTSGIAPFEFKVDVDEAEFICYDLDTEQGREEFMHRQTDDASYKMVNEKNRVGLFFRLFEPLIWSESAIPDPEAEEFFYNAANAFEEFLSGKPSPGVNPSDMRRNALLSNDKTYAVLPLGDDCAVGFYNITGKEGAKRFEAAREGRNVSDINYTYGIGLVNITILNPKPL